ncbi:GTPase [Aureococcus anophagefferens]|nr:GTPase [Aureococcus anophagefferens]
MAAFEDFPDRPMPLVENAIGQLSFVAQLSKHVRFKKPAALEDEDDASEDAARLAAFMPSFTWVLRDSALELVDERGDAITSDEYLEQALKPQRGYEASVLERNRPRPSTVAAPAATYVALLEQYVDAVNSGGVPVISSAWDHPLLDRDVEAALGAAFAAFDARAVGDAKAAKRDELREKTSDFRRDRDAANDRASHAACDELLNALYMDVVWADLAKIAATVARRIARGARGHHGRAGRMLEDRQATLISTQFERRATRRCVSA